MEVSTRWLLFVSNLALNASLGQGVSLCTLGTSKAGKDSKSRATRREYNVEVDPYRAGLGIE
eukprot:881994-Amphidinium_carterae.1